MKKKLTLWLMLCLMGILPLSAASDVLTASTTLPTNGVPEHQYKLMNGNSWYATLYTSPTQTDGNEALFAFYAVDGVDGAYYIYDVTAKKWVCYTKGTSYSSKVNFATLVSSQTSGAYWRAEEITVSGSRYYQFSPYTSAGATTSIYMNWFQGTSSNPMDGTSVTIGLWTDNGTDDGGSRWEVQEVKSYTYTIVCDEDVTVSIGGKTYKNGETYTSQGVLDKSGVTATSKEGQFATINVNGVAGTITVKYYSLPTLRKSEAYTRAIVYPAQQEAVGKAQMEEQDGVYTLYNNVLAASFMKTDDALYFVGSDAMNLTAGTEPFTVGFGSGDEVSASAMTLKSLETKTLTGSTDSIGGAEHYDGVALEANYEYTYEGSTVEILWRAVLRDGSHYLRTEMELKGDGDVDMYDVIPLAYNVDTKAAGSTPKVIGNTRGAVLMSDKIFAGLENPVGYNTVESGAIDTDIVGIQGRWSRNTTLQDGETWKISAVVGLIAQDGEQSNTTIAKTQKRRSFLAYSERERAVPWRCNPAYISWYELNINRNNAAPGSEATNMWAEEVLDVENHWKSSFYDKFGIGPASFVVDDGWDNYGTWTFHSGFPNGFKDIAALASEMGAGIGAWLGPVGGYGQSGTYRRKYWTDLGQSMVLSNPNYYKVFKDAAYNLTKNQGDFRFFKFDGISAQFSATGPDSGDSGNENAEGIIRLERFVREELRRDIFFNTTVGTWASPFWYHYTDATWRQENDYGTIGNSTIDRENWITYRDRLVYQNYVQNSPICPINTLMTHGFILSRFGSVSKSMDYKACQREMRCAFACGSGMVELYNDYLLMDTINGGQLWADLAQCIQWQKKNADVLPDAHWVGGNPWDGSKANIYGWASWNGNKATLALRNGATTSQSITTTLRQAFEIPANVTGSIVLNKAFADQLALTGLSEATAINIDEELTLTLPASSVYIFDGQNAEQSIVKVTNISFDKESYEAYPSTTFVIRATVTPTDATNILLDWSSDDTSIATVKDGYVKAKKVGTTTITATALDGSGVMATVTINVIAKPLEPLSINFEKDAQPSRTDRKITYITLQETDGEEQKVTIDDNLPYHDLTATDTLTCQPGAKLTTTIGYTGTWMHGYVYIDLDNDQQYTFNEGTTDQSGTEVMSFGFYSGSFNNDASGVNSLGKSLSGSSRNLGSPIPNPVFTAPNTEGDYYIRYKVDWNSVDAGGQLAADGTATGTNGILANGGGIVDLILHVGIPTGVKGIVGTQNANDSIYDLSGRKASGTVKGIYIKNNRKIVVR